MENRAINNLYHTIVFCLVHKGQRDQAMPVVFPMLLHLKCQTEVAEELLLFKWRLIEQMNNIMILKKQCIASIDSKKLLALPIIQTLVQVWEVSKQLTLSQNSKRSFLMITTTIQDHPQLREQLQMEVLTLCKLTLTGRSIANWKCVIPSPRFSLVILTAYQVVLNHHTPTILTNILSLMTKQTDLLTRSIENSHTKRTLWKITTSQFSKSSIWDVNAEPK